MSVQDRPNWETVRTDDEAIATQCCLFEGRLVVG